MGIWWAAGFSTAAIRIIDDDARGTCSTSEVSEGVWFSCLLKGLPVGGGDVQVNKFIQILRSEKAV